MKKGEAKTGDRVVPIGNRKGQEYTVAETDKRWRIRLEYTAENGRLANAGWVDCKLYTKAGK